MNITYVTSFMNLSEDRTKLRSPEVHIKNFKILAATGINIYLFLSYSYKDIYDSICGEMKNVYIEYVELFEMDTFISIRDLDIKIPANRNELKDTKNFMILMNTKPEYLHKAIKANIYNTTHYAWIDFGINHIFKDSSNLSNLYTLANSNLPKKCFCIPGCWAQGLHKYQFDIISWRFAGGFFIGDKESIENFYQTTNKLWKETVKTHGLTWEVNYWAYLEDRGLIDVLWYYSDHTDELIDFPFV